MIRSTRGSNAPWRSDDGLRWRPIAPFGAEVDHDLSRELSRSEAAALVRLFDSKALIVARNQDLDMEQQARLMAVVGKVHRTEARSFVSTEDRRSGGKSALAFHSDYAFSDHPLDAISLHAVDVVDDASSTLFANAQQALLRLEPELYAVLVDHRARMIIPGNDAGAARAYLERDPDAKLSQFQGSFYANPRTGQLALRLNELQTAGLEGMPWDAGRDILIHVFSHLYDPAHLIEHRWHGGDLVMWDNFAVQHARRSLDDAGRRILQRVSAGAATLSEMYPELFPQRG